MQKVLLSAILFFLILITFSLFFFFYETKFFGSRASVTQSSISVDNSYVFVTPLRAQANGQQKVRITVFILNSQGLGVLGKKISLSNTPNLLFNVTEPLTDDTGKVVIECTSTIAGDYYIDISTDGITLPQKAHVTFY